MSRLKNIVLYIWQLPQNLLGLLCLLLIKGETRHHLGNITFFFCEKFPGGITLGEYIIVGIKTNFVVRHEYGHVLQSRILGPFYLIVIGLFSLLHAWLNKYLKCCEKHPEGYYHFYTEAWANKLGMKKHNFFHRILCK